MNDSNPQPLIAVDIGNSTMKLGLFDAPLPDGVPQPTEVIQTSSFDAALGPLLERLPQTPFRWRLASVQRQAEQSLAQWVRDHRPQDDYRVLTRHDLELNVDVEHPDDVGVDRLVAAVAANHLRASDRAAIVVDAGSAVTVDAVSADGVFLGGAILPGVMMVAQALAEQADLLPLIELTPDDEKPPVLGKSTEGAMRSGLFWGVVGAVRELVQRISPQFDSPPQVFLSGGLGSQLAPLLSGDTRYAPHLVLRGIALASRSGKEPS